MFNGSDLINSPFATMLKVFTDLLGNGFFIIPVAVIGAALFRQKKDVAIVSIYFISTFALLGAGALIGGNATLGKMFLLLAGATLTAVIVSFMFLKR
jgi:hypothetical protein